jgi:hypothetical protein
MNLSVQASMLLTLAVTLGLVFALAVLWNFCEYALLREENERRRAGE